VDFCSGSQKMDERRQINDQMMVKLKR